MEKKEQKNGGNPGITREEVLKYAKKKYHTTPEYPWKGDPDSAVLRHEDNRKWYGLIMYVSRSRLGLPDREPADILNVKCDAMLGELLRREPGIFPAYHMNHREWLSILLDGTVPRDKVLDLLDMSYSLTMSKKKRERSRGPIEWLIPANPRYYDVEEGFRQNPVMDWKQSSNVKAGDIIYMYMAAPVSAILYKCKAVEVDIPCYYEDSHLTMRRMMKIQLLERYDPARFTRDVMRQFGVYGVRGPRSMPHSLSCEINGRYE